MGAARERASREGRGLYYRGESSVVAGRSGLVVLASNYKSCLHGLHLSLQCTAQLVLGPGAIKMHGAFHNLQCVHTYVFSPLKYVIL